MLSNYNLDWKKIRQHYDARLNVSNQILASLHAGQTSQCCRRALGISDPLGNYSASEHRLGPRIYQNANAEKRVLNLMRLLRTVSNGDEVPRLIRLAALDFLKIGVGSELSMMVNPRVCWVANTRTVWAHLLIKHGWDENAANEELQLYRDHDETSEMAYQKWVIIHQTMRRDMIELAADGSKLSKKAAVQPGEMQYIWADAVANWLYEEL